MKGNITNFILIGGSILWSQTSYIYPVYSISDTIFHSFYVACLHFYFIPWLSDFSPACIIHTCVHAYAQNLSCFYADRSGVKKGCPLPSDTFQMSDCNSSSLKRRFTGAPLDRQFIFSALHYSRFQNTQNMKIVIILLPCLLHCKATLFKIKVLFLMGKV